MPLCGDVVSTVIVRQAKLRFPIPPHLEENLVGQILETVTRRAKYLLCKFQRGSLLLHLGMSGRLQVLKQFVPAGRHDHFDLLMQSGSVLRLHDPRRFGAVLWLDGDPYTHPLLMNLGVEPLSVSFDADYLYTYTRHRRLAIKMTLMDSRLVVGIGNIYANEALFDAGILPTRAANSLSQPECARLVVSVGKILQAALVAGGSSLRDFLDTDGKAGYFQQSYAVYGRAQAPCVNCAQPLQRLRLSQRSTFFCRFCQR